MIDYETALELKKAGFPQYGKGDYYRVYQGFDPVVDKLPEEAAYIPILEELLAACGGDFTQLMRKENLWLAHAKTEKYNSFEFGTTPSEAVARLWRALNRTAQEEHIHGPIYI